MAARHPTESGEELAWPLAWPKRCACGSTWSANTWKALDYVGVWDDGVDAVELRHCTCGSTIAMLVSAIKTGAMARCPPSSRAEPRPSGTDGGKKTPRILPV